MKKDPTNIIKIKLNKIITKINNIHKDNEENKFQINKLKGEYTPGYIYIT